MSLKLETPKEKHVEIKAPNFEVAVIPIRGTAPLVMHRFSSETKAGLMAKHEEGSKKAAGKKDKPPRDFEKDYQGAFHTAREGWHGIPCGAFRNAAISACRTVGYKMTHAKLAFFILGDGFEAEDGTPLIRITGKPKKHTAYARNDNGSVDIRIRPMWEEWTAELRVRYDADMFSAQDVSNLIMRVGMQVGLLEGRPDSKNSAGQGWGTFEIVQEEEKKRASR